MGFTEILDPVLKHVADKVGIPADEYSRWTGGEIVGVILETIADFTTKGWLNKALQGLAGVLSYYYATKTLRGSTKRELVGLGNHLIGRVTDPKPESIAELKESISSLKSVVESKMKEGDVLGAIIEALKTGIRSKEELESTLGITLGIPSPAPSPAPSPTYTVEVSKPTPSGATVY